MSHSFGAAILVGIGGFAGAVSRYGVSMAMRNFSASWPTGTLAANILGCLLIGMIAAFSARGEWLTPELRLMLATGFCGGFTTMSSMIYETAEMLRGSEYLLAAMYVVGTLILSMAAFIAGILAVRLLFRIGGGAWN